MVSTRCALIAAVFGLETFAFFQPLSAQPLSSLATGQRVRVTIESSAISNQVATVGSLSEGRITLMMPGDSLVRVGAAMRQVTVPIDSLTRLEVSRGFRSHPWKGAIIGAIALGAAGAAGFGKGLFYTCDGGFAPGCDFARAMGAVGGVVAGGVIGGAIGWLVRTERWEPVVLLRVHVLVAPQAGGRLGLGASLAF
jgi:hypothetical protein